MTHLTIARSYLGTKELKGSADNPKIMEMYRTIGHHWAVLPAALIAALGIAWLKGRAAGKAAWETKRQAARDRAIRHSGEIRNDVQNSSDPALDRRLGRWMRD